MFKVSLLHYYKCQFGPLLFIVFESAITTRYVLLYCKQLTRTIDAVLYSAKKEPLARTTQIFFNCMKPVPLYISTSHKIIIVDLTYLCSGGLPHRATETERTAGSTHYLSGKLIPGKMHTPTCWPKMRKATCTKFSVSSTSSSIHFKDQRSLVF